MKKYSLRLEPVYQGQQGFFTRRQALKAGYSSTAINYNLAVGNWEKEAKGVYSIRNPLAGVVREDLIIPCLWGQNRKGEPEIIISHDTALEYYDMSDIQSYGTHITISKNCRRDLEGFHVRKRGFNKSDYVDKEGFLITTPIKTLVDVLDDDSPFPYSEEIIDGAIVKLFLDHLTNEDEIAALKIPRKSKTNLYMAFKYFSEKYGTDFTISHVAFEFAQQKVKKALDAVKKIEPIALRQTKREISNSM